MKKVIPEGLDGIENFKYEPVVGFVVSQRFTDGKSKTKKQRVFDITKYRRRHIALRVVVIRRDKGVDLLRRFPDGRLCTAR